MVSADGAQSAQSARWKAGPQQADGLSLLFRRPQNDLVQQGGQDAAEWRGNQVDAQIREIPRHDGGSQRPGGIQGGSRQRATHQNSKRQSQADGYGSKIACFSVDGRIEYGIDKKERQQQFDNESLHRRYGGCQSGCTKSAGCATQNGTQCKGPQRASD